MTLSPDFESRLPVGSSASTIDGRLTMARAMATRWRSPPLTWLDVADAVRQPDAFECLGGPAPTFGRCDAAVQQAAGDVLERGETVEQEELLKHEPEQPRTCSRELTVAERSTPCHPATLTAPRRTVERADDVQQRRLAGS